MGEDNLQIIADSKGYVMNDKDYVASVLNITTNVVTIQSVAPNKAALGYIGFVYIEKDVKLIKISDEKGKTYISATMASILDKTYPMVRPLYYYYYYYYLTAVEKMVKPFIDYTLSVT